MRPIRSIGGWRSIKLFATTRSSLALGHWDIPRGSDRSRAVKEYLATLDDVAFGAANGYAEVHLAIRSRRAMDGSDANADKYLVDVKFG
jgi:hypothetical protein